MDNIFISYSHKDSDQVHPLIKRLLKDGYDVWYDEGIDPGTEWDENIARHLKECAGIIAFISDNYLASENCRDEINYARDLGKERLIVYLEDSELPAGMAMRLNRIQAIHRYKYKDDEGFYSELIKAPMLKDRKGKSPDVDTGSGTEPLSKKEFIRLPEYRTLANIVLIAAVLIYILGPLLMISGEYFGTPVVLALVIIGHYKLDHRFVIPAAVLTFILGCIFTLYLFILFVFTVIFLLGLLKVNVLYRQYISSGEKPPIW